MHLGNLLPAESNLEPAGEVSIADEVPVAGAAPLTNEILAVGALPVAEVHVEEPIGAVVPADQQPRANM